MTDPTPLFEHFRGSYGSELLTAAVAHFDLFGILSAQPMTPAELGERLGLAPRPLVVLTTAMSAMQLLQQNDADQFEVTELATKHLTLDSPVSVADYIGLAAGSPGVLEMVERLRTNRPAGADDEEEGAAFIYRAGVPSAMEQTAAARHFTLALAGRAKNVAPKLADAVDASSWKKLIDVGGGTGIYSIEMVKRHPHLQAVVIDRPQVLKVAEEFVQEHNVADRVTLVEGDMFSELPTDADAILLSNILHDWDEPECRQLVNACASSLETGGQLLIHDVFLNDELTGPLAIALYSAALFTLTEGRAYSGAEYRGWLEAANLTPQPIVPTAIHCGVLVGVKR